MKFTFLAVLFFVFNTLTGQQFEIGKASDLKNTITADTLILTKAINRLLNDGTVITNFSIESKGAFHYLVARGLYKNFAKIIALNLVYDIKTRTYYAAKNDGYITCASAACNNCSLFKENGKISGCKCAEKATISNQCNFTRVEQSAFYLNIIRAKQMMKDK